MQVICIHEPAFYELLDKVIERLKDQNGTKEDRWISGDETMRLLGVKSKTTLQTLRDEGKIRFTKNTPVMMYDRNSINAYLEKNAQDTF